MFLFVSSCSSVMLLNDKVCERRFAMKALEYRNDLSIAGQGNVRKCARTINFISTMLGRATAQ